MPAKKKIDQPTLFSERIIPPKKKAPIKAKKKKPHPKTKVVSKVVYKQRVSEYRKKKIFDQFGFGTRIWKTLPTEKELNDLWAEFLEWNIKRDKFKFTQMQFIVFIGITKRTWYNWKERCGKEEGFEFKKLLRFMNEITAFFESLYNDISINDDKPRGAIFLLKHNFKYIENDNSASVRVQQQLKTVEEQALKINFINATETPKEEGE